MKILLTGGAGYIGSHTCVELLEAGYDVVVVDNYVNSQPEAISRVEAITGKKVTAYEADVCDGDALEKIFAAETIDAVIHFAGLKAVGESVEMPLKYYRNNLDSTLTLLETMKKHGCTRIVLSSSATVY
ncbi:MAG: SDR family NAD(P)-dependent oxidoreductase, partial [Clostridia bacterium]|nr:SDR family NAD(P)-dependent oxidoreductase [Clostridia bacterium]